MMSNSTQGFAVDDILSDSIPNPKAPPTRAKRFHSRGIARFRMDRCENCGAVKSGKGLRSLSVHHIDGDTLNNDPANLRTLCQKCHIGIVHQVPGRPAIILPESQLRQFLLIPGMSVVEIARRLGVTRRIAMQNIKRYGLHHHGLYVSRRSLNRKRQS